MSSVDRRDFMKATLGAFAAGSLLAQGCASRGFRPATPKVLDRPIGANEDIRVAIIGLRGRGNGLMGEFMGMKGVRVVALCDPDRQVLASRIQALAKAEHPVAAYVDVRKLIEDDEIDAVVIATPNHWHSLIGIWACQAGKDVYVEKPVSHNVWEGRQLVKAARKYQRIVQTGTQSRSDRALAAGLEYCRAGNLGKVQLVRGLCYKRRASIGKVDGPQKVPDFIDYDLWTGPAPMHPLMRKSLHYDWHWVFETGNGDLGNQGIHQMDICRWATGEQELSPRVISVGGRFGYDDDGNTPNTQIVYHDYDEIPVLFEVRGLPTETGVNAMPHYKGIRIGNVVHCEGGYFAGNSVYDHDGNRMKTFEIEHGSGHAANFIEAVRKRNREHLHADILQGHLSSALCHTGNISYRLGETARPEEIMDEIRSEPDMVDAFERMKEHLAANDVSLDATPATIGPLLCMDPDTERFVGARAREANALLSRDYREPFVVPEEV